MTWHDGGTMKFARSTDLGDSWTTSTISSGSGQRGIGSDITSDADGVVYYLWPAYNTNSIWMRRSTDGGASFEPAQVVATTEASYDFPIPSMDTRNVFVYVSAAADHGSGPYRGSVYAAWTDSTAPTGGSASNNHARIQVAYSRDGGATWQTTTPHETADQNSVDRWHQWLAVGPDGTVHVVFYDTRRDPSRSSVDMFWSYSTDGAETWSTPERLTSEMSPEINDFFEFGDYNGLDVVLNELVAIFTDNRNEGGGGGDSVDVYVAGRVLEASDAFFADGFESGDTFRWSLTTP
jgi:Neuraminidase (sialidase)